MRNRYLVRGKDWKICYYRYKCFSRQGLPYRFISIVKLSFVGYEGVDDFYPLMGELIRSILAEGPLYERNFLIDDINGGKNPESEHQKNIY